MILISSGIMIIIVCAVASNDIDKGLEKEGKISLSVPHLSEEETRSNHMPDHLRCDACLAVTYQMSSVLSTYQKKANVKLKESEILEIIDNICSSSFENYGVKQVNGENRLSGPGLDTEHVMGMTQMGGRWPHRLQEMCYNYVGETGELELYEIFLSGEKKLQEFLCYRSGLYGYCSYSRLIYKTEL